MTGLLYAGGIYHLAFGLFHIGFWRIFRWHTELPRLGFVNRNIVQILNLCLTFVFFAVAWLSFRHAEALLAPGLGHTLLGIIAGFWLLRAILQLWFFGLRNPLSAAFFVVFVTGVALYAIPLFA